jgi:hypothetical protein
MAYFRTILVGSLAFALSACGGDDDEDPKPSDTGPLPIVFVHGFAGSAQQYESQAMRFVANGFPADRIFALDHDGAGTDYAGYGNLVDALVDQVRAKLGVDKVILVGHSRGTTVSSGYLYNPTRAAKVAKYISLDGRGCVQMDVTAADPNATATPLPAEIPCVAPNQDMLQGQAHVEVASSEECFVEQYKFLMGKEPAVTKIERQDGPVTLSGRLVNFPANTGRLSTLEVYEIHADTGHRLSSTPIKTFTIDDSGDWGPVEVDSDKRYEMAMSPVEGGIQHFYLQPYLRSSRFVRLLSGPLDSPIRVNTHRGPNHVTATAIRMREWYGDPSPMPTGGGPGGTRPRPADKMDVLEVGTTSPSGGNEAPVNVISARTGNGTIAIHLHDDAATPKQSTLGELTNLTGCGVTCTAFQSTSDLYMPAAEPPDGTITFTNYPRGDQSKPQVLKVPNWASEPVGSKGHLIHVIFRDYAL